MNLLKISQKNENTYIFLCFYRRIEEKFIKQMRKNGYFIIHLNEFSFGLADI